MATIPFLDLRLAAKGQGLSARVAVNQLDSAGGYTSMRVKELRARVRGQHVLLATHGYNVDRADGLASLSNWAGLLQLPPAAVFVGLLWPGDSVPCWRRIWMRI
jgi:esterase/lipase superfamily enzyme